MTVGELESKLSRLPQTANVRIQVGDNNQEIKEIMYEEFEFLPPEDDLKDIVTLMG